MKSFKKTVLYVLLAIVSQCQTAIVADKQPSESLYGSHNLFAADLFYVIAEGKSSENIVYSPAAIQTCMALLFMGAEGETAVEMRKVLRLAEDDKPEIAKAFGKLLETDSKYNNFTGEAPQLNMINRLYVNQGLEIAQDFNQIALKYFDTQAEKVNFTAAKSVVEYINQWVAQQTADKIKDILTQDAVNNDTNAILINAIYFKAKWLNAFSSYSTALSRFYMNLNDSQEAQIMYNEEYYGYAELPELEAAALEMPFNNSDMSMLIILPNEIEGLPQLELKLRNKNLNDIASKLVVMKVHAHVPKFTIEFDIDLKEPLEKMGLVTSFTSSANFKSLFTTPQFQSISEIKHKAFLDVNEAGSEAVAATFVALTNLSAFFERPIFRADHPFLFAIRSKSVVYFAGHVTKI